MEKLKVVATIDLETYNRSILTKGKVYDGIKKGDIVHIINDRGENECYSLNGSLVVNKNVLLCYGK